jgi:hypothetical protein
LGISFLPITQSFLSKLKKNIQQMLVLRRSVATSKAPICLVLTLLQKLDIFRPELGVATLHALFGSGILGPPLS